MKINKECLNYQNIPKHMSNEKYFTMMHAVLKLEFIYMKP